MTGAAVTVSRLVVLVTSVEVSGTAVVVTAEPVTVIETERVRVVVTDCIEAGNATAQNERTPGRAGNGANEANGAAGAATAKNGCWVPTTSIESRRCFQDAMVKECCR